MDIEEIKLFLRVDGTDEDLTIAGLQIAAENYIGGAGVIKDYSNDLYKLAVKLLMAHWYENREVVGKADKLAFSLGDIIINIKYNQVVVVV